MRPVARWLCEVKHIPVPTTSQLVDVSPHTIYQWSSSEGWNLQLKPIPVSLPPVAAASTPLRRCPHCSQLTTMDPCSRCEVAWHG